MTLTTEQIKEIASKINLKRVSSEREFNAEHFKLKMEKINLMSREDLIKTLLRTKEEIGKKDRKFERIKRDVHIKSELLKELGVTGEMYRELLKMVKEDA